MRLVKRRRRAAAPAPLGIVLLAAAAGAAAAGVTVVRRRRAASGSGQSTFTDADFTVSAPPSQEPAAEAVEQTWSCQCGQEYRVSGEGRHRVYWLRDASVSDPVIDGRCPTCERPLPGEQPEPAEAS